MSKYIFFIGLFICRAVIADVPAEQLKEVDYLMAFIEKSGCVINRNGTDYPAENGISHIKMKYDHFREDIKSSEEFIEYAATKSTMSGKYYMVTCPGKEAVPTKDWLLTELKKFRLQ